ncbi:MAG: GIY-YIG nuclease family protein [Nitrospirota bacterium]
MITKSTKKPHWYLYILQCRDQTFYTGITTDPDRRVCQHNAGTGSRYTRSRLPIRMIFCESCKNKSEALKKEYAIKRLNRSKKEEYIKTNHKFVRYWP